MDKNIILTVGLIIFGIFFVGSYIYLRVVFEKEKF
jgi:hypothetical protein